MYSNVPLLPMHYAVLHKCIEKTEELTHLLYSMYLSVPHNVFVGNGNVKCMNVCVYLILLSLYFLNLVD